MYIINKETEKLVRSDIWRNHFHIQPPTGLLNDPNGLIYHDGVYHVFYQWHPDAPVHGLKYWNHLTSSDLVTWKKDDRIIEPFSKYNANGAYSGSAFLVNNEIELFYTGNTRNESGQRHPYQLRSRMNEDSIDEPSVLIDGIPEGYTDHFRDPKILLRDGRYFMILGAQTVDLKGTALVYESDDAMDWKFAFQLKTPYDGLGYMWECPDIASFDANDVLLFCPQGSMNFPKDQTNIYPSAYLAGKFEWKEGRFSTTSQPELIDHGFDFYAAQTFTDENDEQVLFAWIGMPEVDYPSDKNMWAHVLTIPRLLSLKDNKLYQIPHPNLEALRREELSSLNNLSTYELKIDNITDNINLKLYSSEIESLELNYDMDSQTLTLDRGNMLNQFATEHGTRRSISMDEPLRSLWILRDTSTVEIFINDGRYTMTSRFFPKTVEGDIRIDYENKSQLDVNAYSMNNTNSNL